MDKFIHVVASGARQIRAAQAINAHNLANASTVGFRQDMAKAETLYLRGAGAETRAYSVLTDTAPDLRTGMVEQTGRDLDLAINGEGWFAVQGSDGVETLTRRGDMRVDEFGQLVNGENQVLMGDSGPIALPPFSSLSIATDGTISIVPLGEPPTAIAALDRIKMVNPPTADLRKNETGGLEAVTQNGLPLEADASVQLISGALESSNVDSIGAMVEMIELARQFEGFVKTLKAGETMSTSSASLMRMQS
ncbi:MAG: flagellar basal body rod protein FlgF [Halieaceae bacterium]|jgi:flagellar basal-body rod protein FlgF|nr:flagellar basal body rod protein FlgF [Halieaceae bacterium]